MERRTVLSSIGFSPYLYYDAFGSRHTSSVSVTWQGIRNSGAASSLVPGGTSVTSNFTVYVNHTSTLPARMVIGLNAGLTSANDLDATFGNLTLNVPVIEGLLTASASGNTNTSRGLSYSTTVTGGTLAGIWTPWSHHTFSLTGRINHVATGSSTFTESFLTLTYNLSL